MFAYDDYEKQHPMRPRWLAFVLARAGSEPAFFYLENSITSAVRTSIITSLRRMNQGLNGEL
jgi:hypothetical protein